MSMEFTNQGVELKSRDFKNLARMFEIAIERDIGDWMWGLDPKHELTIEARSRLDPARAVLAHSEGKDRVLIPLQQLPAIVSLAELALNSPNLIYDFCEDENPIESVPMINNSIPPLTATAHRTMALAADLVEQMHVDQTFNQLVETLE